MARAEGTAPLALAGVVAGVVSVVAGAVTVIAGAVVAVVPRLIEVDGSTVKATVDGGASAVGVSGADAVAAEPAAIHAVMATMADALAAPTIRRARAAGWRWAEERGSMCSMMAGEAVNTLGAVSPSAGFRLGGNSQEPQTGHTG